MHVEKSSPGVLKLPPNVRCVDSTLNGDMFRDVAEEDKDHMKVIFNYCATRIAKKHEDVDAYIYYPRDEKTKAPLVYQVFFSFSLGTKISDAHFNEMKAYAYRKITMPIEVDYDPVTKLQRLKIIINPVARLPEYEDMTITTIHMKNNRLNLIYDNDTLDDERGSTKRVRTR